MKREPEVLALLACEISHSLAAYTVVDADVILDEARRLFFMVTFSGTSLEECIKMLVVPDPAVEVAHRFDGYTCEEVEIIVSTVRSAVWFAGFASLAGTRVGSLLKQFQLDHSAAGAAAGSNAKPN